MAKLSLTILLVFFDLKLLFTSLKLHNWINII